MIEDFTGTVRILDADGNEKITLNGNSGEIHAKDDDGRRTIRLDAQIGVASLGGVNNSGGLFVEGNKALVAVLTFNDGNPGGGVLKLINDNARETVFLTGESGHAVLGAKDIPGSIHIQNNKDQVAI